jgi:hypothetical protein
MTAAFCGYIGKECKKMHVQKTQRATFGILLTSMLVLAVAGCEQLAAPNPFLSPADTSDFGGSQVEDDELDSGTPDGSDQPPPATGFTIDGDVSDWPSTPTHGVNDGSFDAADAAADITVAGFERDPDYFLIALGTRNNSFSSAFEFRFEFDLDNDGYGDDGDFTVAVTHPNSLSVYDSSGGIADIEQNAAFAFGSYLEVAVPFTANFSNPGLITLRVYSFDGGVADEIDAQQIDLD